MRVKTKKKKSAEAVTGSTKNDNDKTEDNLKDTFSLVPDDEIEIDFLVEHSPYTPSPSRGATPLPPRQHLIPSTMELEKNKGKTERVRVSEVLSSNDYKKTHKVPKKHSRSPQRRLPMATDLKTMGEQDYRDSVATEDSARESEVMKETEVDFGLTNEQIEKMTSTSFNSFVQKSDKVKKTNETFGSETLRKEVALNLNRKRRMETAKELKKREREERGPWWLWCA